MPLLDKAHQCRYLTARELGDQLTPTEAGFVLALEMAHKGPLTLEEIQEVVGYSDHSGAVHLLQRLERVAPALTKQANARLEESDARFEWRLLPGGFS